MTQNNFSRIAIVVAMQSEYEMVKHILTDGIERLIGSNRALEGSLGQKSILLLHCGIGKVNAAMLATEAIAAFSPDCMINTGVAGGIGGGLKVGDIVVAKECTYHDVWCGEGAWGQVQGLPARFEADGRLLDKMAEIDRENIRFGLCCTGDQFISDIAALQEIKRRFPDGLSVDMESTAMAQVCYLRQVPFLSLRVVSDTPGMDDDNASQYRNFWTEAPKRTFDIVSHFIAIL